MSFTIAEFRAAFPAFADTSQYPDPEVQFWIDLGLKLHNVDRWADLLDYGMQLFVAHNLALESGAGSAGAGGGTPGGVMGPLTSASVDKVSYSRNPGLAMDPTNGHWNLTVWGLRWVRLMKMVGAGPIQVEAQLGDTNYPTGLGWPGVVPAPWG